MQEITQAIVFAIASVLHGITGMAFPMIGTTALAFMMPLSQAVALVALPSVVMSFLVIIANRQKSIIQELIYYLKKYQLLVISSIIGGIVGVKLLLILPNYILYLAMSVITLYYVLLGFLSLKGKVKELKVPTHNISMIIFGFLAGIIGGSTNAMSPILLMFLMSYSQDKNQIAKSSNLCYLLGKVVQIIFLKEQFATFNQGQWVLLIVLTIISMGFLFIGIWLRNKISIEKFKSLTYFVLLVLAIKIGYSGLQGLVA